MRKKPKHLNKLLIIALNLFVVIPSEKITLNCFAEEASDEENDSSGDEDDDLDDNDATDEEGEEEEDKELAKMIAEPTSSDNEDEVSLSAALNARKACAKALKAPGAKRNWYSGTVVPGTRKQSTGGKRSGTMPTIVSARQSQVEHYSLPS